MSETQRRRIEAHRRAWREHFEAEYELRRLMGRPFSLSMAKRHIAAQVACHEYLPGRYGGFIGTLYNWN